MKVLGIVASPRKGGNTEILVTEALEGAKSAGAEVELFTVADKTIAPCDGCLACGESAVCKIKDDMQELYTKMVEADGIIFGTPVYFSNVSAQAKIIMDRTQSIYRARKLRGKTAAAIVAVRRIGAGSVLSSLYTFFTAHGMMIAGGGIGFGREKGEVRTGVGGSPNLSALEEAKAVGRNVSRMADMMAKARK